MSMVGFVFERGLWSVPCFLDEQDVTSDGLAPSFSSTYFAHGPRKVSISPASPPLTFFLFSDFLCPLSNTVSPGKT